MRQPLLTKAKRNKNDENNIPLHPGWHPLHIAAFNGDIKWAKQLVHSGAYITAIDIYGRTPLHYARRRKYGIKNDEVAKLLIDSGADEYSPLDSKGRRPIDIYAEYNDEI